MRRRSRSRSRRGRQVRASAEHKGSKVSARQQAEAEARQLEQRLRREERDRARRREVASSGVGKRRGEDRAQCEPSVQKTLDEVRVRKLFELLDRSGKGQVSQRDVLIALKKQPPVRRLFGLPVTNVEQGGNALEARLLAIQDAFEGGSGLGELGPIFEKLRADGTGQGFGWRAFLASCREEPMQARASAAAELLPREHATGPAFVATHAWEVVPEGAACPGGLEYKMDMETGRTLARLMPSKASERAMQPGRSRVTTHTLACT
mmetsp:Transcript_59796/g.192455  ORF Transcript_59796/g.192455 Transcript_59796/m.192455 type:complete len:264 (+) Transcript_59796:108-899(+)